MLYHVLSCYIMFYHVLSCCKLYLYNIWCVIGFMDAHWYAHTHIYIYIYVMYILYMGSVSRHQPIGFRSQLMWQTAPWNPIIFYGLSQASKGQQSLSLSAYIYTHTNLCKYNRYIRMYIHTIYLYMYDYTYLHAHTHTRAHKHTPTHTHTHTHIHTHTYIYIYICIRMHTCAWMAGFGLGIWTSSPPRRLWP